MANKMLLILTTGPEDRGNRATLAFSMGVAALISGVEAHVYLTMGGAFWSRRESVKSVQIEGFEPLNVYVDQFVEAGGRILVCSPCYEFFCSIASKHDVMKGAELVGLTHVVDLALESSVITL